MTKDTQTPDAIKAINAPPRTVRSVYPEPFASMMEGRTKHPLGDLFGIKNFGVNLTRLEPSAQSALLHQHKSQDEFIYIIEGNPTLVTDKGDTPLSPGMCAGFAANGVAHKLENRTTEDVLYLGVGDRTPGDQVTYPADDLVAKFVDGHWKFFHKDGTAYSG